MKGKALRKHSLHEKTAEHFLGTARRVHASICANYAKPADWLTA